MKTIFTITCLLTIFVASAQWTTDTDANTLVAESGELDVLARGTSDGHTYAVYWKNVAPPVNIELRLQILDADGNRLFGNDGMLISDQIPMGSFTVSMAAVVDADDNLYIGVTGTGGGDPAYVFKMDTSGNFLWNTSGVNVGSGHKVTILPLSGGGAIVGWLSSSGTLMQKYDGSGTAIWATPMPIAPESGFGAPESFFELSNGDIIAVFHKLLSGINSNLYAQRYDTDGNSVWANTVQLSDGLTAFNRNYSSLQDGNVVYVGYFSAANNRFDSYLQRINPDGTLPWGINGADFDTNQTDYEMETEIAFQNGSQYIYSISTYRDSNQSERGEYVQKFDKDSGARQFTDNAKVVFPIGDDKSHAGALRLRNGSSLFLMEAGDNNGVSPTTLHAVYLDENGDFAWPEETRPVATFAAAKSRVNFTSEGNGQNVAVFVEDKGDGLRIYAQNVEDDTAGVTDFNELALFFANPVKDEMALRSNSAIQNISVYNVLGQQIFSQGYQGDNEIYISTNNWKAGIYFMNVSTEEGLVKGVKLIKR